MSAELSKADRVKIVAPCSDHPVFSYLTGKAERRDYKGRIIGKAGTVEAVHEFYSAHGVSVRFDEPEIVGQIMIMGDHFRGEELELLPHAPGDADRLLVELERLEAVRLEADRRFWELASQFYASLRSLGLSREDYWALSLADARASVTYTALPVEWQTRIDAWLAICERRRADYDRIEEQRRQVFGIPTPKDAR